MSAAFSAKKTARGFLRERAEGPCEPELEEELRAQLEHATSGRRVRLANIIAGKGKRNTGVDASELRVVPSVKAFRTEFKACTTLGIDHKALEHSQVPIVTAWAIESVVRQVAEGSR